jgi:chromatin remodeling complex protein RSC6
MAVKKKESALARPVEISDELAAIVGKGPMPRTQITKKLWEYIKKNDCQDPEERRTIVTDAKLKAVLSNKKRVDMFEMTRLVNKHILS